MPKAVVTATFAIAAILVAAMAGVRGTTASFSDRATSSGNTFTAGTLLMNLGATPGCDGRHYGGESGNPGADGNAGCTNGGALTWTGGAAMTPGGQATGSIVVQNAGSLDGTLSSPAPTLVSSDPVNCPATSSNFTLAPGAFPTALAASGQSQVPLTAAVPSTSADGCQGVTFTAAIPFHLDGPGSPGFTDSAVSTGNTLTMATLLAPLSVTATPTGSNAATVTWTPASNDHAAGYEIYRRTGTCSGWTPLAGEQRPGPATSPYSDSALAANTQYCYAVRGVNQNWVSDFTFGSGTTSDYPKLYTTTGNALIGATGTGQESLGCATLIVVLGNITGCASLGPSSITFSSVDTYDILSGSGWAVRLDTTITILIGLGTQNIVADLWYVPAAGSCGTGPSAGTLIGTGVVTLSAAILQLLQSVQTQLTVPIPSNATLPTASGARLCLRVSGNPSLLSLGIQSPQFTINNGTDSFIQGPFAP